MHCRRGFELWRGIGVKDLLSCRGCRRLTHNLDKLRVMHPDWHNRPVPGIGPTDADLLILGLAPGRLGANRTGKPFVGDRSSKWLSSRMFEAGLMDEHGTPVGVRISNAVKCLPPGNAPKVSEINRCVQRWLKPEILKARVILALGKVAHNAVLRGVDTPLAHHPFSHGSIHTVGKLRLVDSFHPSPLNTQTGRLSTVSFLDVLRTAKQLAAEPH